MKTVELPASVLATVLNALDCAIQETQERIIDAPGLPGGMDKEDLQFLESQEADLETAIEVIESALDQSEGPTQGQLQTALEVLGDAYATEGGIPAYYDGWFEDTMALLVDCHCDPGSIALVVEVCVTPDLKRELLESIGTERVGL